MKNKDYKQGWNDAFTLIVVVVGGWLGISLIYWIVGMIFGYY